jgi:hypothetical protein
VTFFRRASGVLCFGPSILSSIALILSIFGNSRCNLVKVPITNDAVSNIFPIEPISVGLWCFEGTNGSLYDTRDVSFDSKFDAARALGVTTLCLGWIIVIFYLVAGCKRFPPTAFRIVGFLALLACMFQGLVFLVYKSFICALGCSLDTGGKCAISAAVIWFLTATTSCAAGKKEEEEDKPDEENN